MAFQADSLIPARFLILLANLIILILALWTRDGNVVASLPYEFEEEEYYFKDKELIVGLSLGIAFIGVEFIGFFSGISMFKPSIGLLSIFLHGLSCVLTSQWLIHSWQASSYWLIFGAFSILPAAVESINMICILTGAIKEL
ncbi:transmembrane protein 107-like isoform X1 [Halyomorpha halys]|uniref:transmembrane protein 107-like isoform X1 n=1 Tax=Halyomorpha halys TaxID=286706 RepID=UPI0034D2EE2B